MLMSALLAPVRMLFHTQFVAAALLGWSIQWKSPARADKSTSIAQALRRHGLQTAIGRRMDGPGRMEGARRAAMDRAGCRRLAVGDTRFGVDQLRDFGLLMRRAKIFMTPDETRPPREVIATAQYARNARALPRFADAVIDPEVSCSGSQRGAVVRDRRLPLRSARSGSSVRCSRVLSALSRCERVALLHDGAALDQMHRAARVAPIHASWYASADLGGAARPFAFLAVRPSTRQATHTVATMARVR